jgi:hypothetical protein
MGANSPMGQQASRRSRSLRSSPSPRPACRHQSIRLGPPTNRPSSPGRQHLVSLRQWLLERHHRYSRSTSHGSQAAAWATTPQWTWPQVCTSRRPAHGAQGPRPVGSRQERTLRVRPAAGADATRPTSGTMSALRRACRGGPLAAYRRSLEIRTDHGLPSSLGCTGWKALLYPGWGWSGPPSGVRGDGEAGEGEQEVGVGQDPAQGLGESRGIDGSPRHDDQDRGTPDGRGPGVSGDGQQGGGDEPVLVVGPGDRRDRQGRDSDRDDGGVVVTSPGQGHGGGEAGQGDHHGQGQPDRVRGEER